MNVVDLKKRLDNRENIELHNGDDLAVIAKSKLTNHYIFIFNSKGLFSYKTFTIFCKKANEKVLQYSLIELDS